MRRSSYRAYRSCPRAATVKQSSQQHNNHGNGGRRNQANQRASYC